MGQDKLARGKGKHRLYTVYTPEVIGNRWRKSDQRKTQEEMESYLTQEESSIKKKKKNRKPQDTKDKTKLPT